MSYLITITKVGKVVAKSSAIGNRDALMDAAYDEYGVCGVSIMAQAHTVRTRCSAQDPFQGLRGHAYIKARGLNPRIEPIRATSSDEESKLEQAQLLSAVQAICAPKVGA